MPRGSILARAVGDRSVLQARAPNPMGVQKEVFMFHFLEKIQT